MTNSHMDKFPYKITVWEFVHMVISSTSLTSGLDPVAMLVHGEGESLVQVGHMLQALVYTAHISSTFPPKLQHVWKPSLMLLKVGPGSLPHQYRPSYTGDSHGFYRGLWKAPRGCAIVVGGGTPEENVGDREQG